MHILFLANCFPYPADNGSKKRVKYLLLALTAWHEVTLLSFTSGTVDRTNRKQLAKICKYDELVLSNPHLEEHPVQEAMNKVNKVLANQVFDVVIASTKTMAIYAMQVPGYTIRILEEHESTSYLLWEKYVQEQSSLRRLRLWVGWKKQRAYEARVIPKFDLCTLVSVHDQRMTLDVLRHRPPRLKVIPNGVDCQHNRFDQYKPQPNHLVFNGALTNSDNYEAMRFFLRSIYPRVKEVFPRVSLMITGSTECVNKDGLELDESVHFSEYVEDVRSLVGEATVCVVPMRHGSGTRHKILEAMALGTPVVCTTQAALGLNVIHERHLLIADYAEAFAEQTVRLLQNNVLRNHLKKEARLLVEEEYDWEDIGRQFVRHVEDSVLARE